jgi:N-glycosylase/DNA lyase
MKRALDALFPGMSPSDFGENAGIAQQYIFHYSRMHPELFAENKKVEK